MVELAPIDQFQQYGFASWSGFLDDLELEELQTQLERFHSQIVPKLPREHVFYEDKAKPETLKQIQQMGTHDEWFGALINQGRFRQLAEDLLAGPVVPKNLQYFNKPAGVGKATPPHQDGYYFMLKPCEAVTLWLALDDVDEENGCVRYVRGSHEGGMREHGRTETLGFSQGIVDYPSESDRAFETPVYAAPGDLLAHQAMTIHRADANQSLTRSRRALGFIYYSEKAREDTDAHAAYQAKLAREMKAADKI